MGEDKCLYVQYTFHGLPHEVTIQDAESLRIPKQCKYLLEYVYEEWYFHQISLCF